MLRILIVLLLTTHFLMPGESMETRSYEDLYKIATCEPDSTSPIMALECFTLKRSLQYETYGRELLCQGKVGVIVAAGGQGTRAGSLKPKGLWPISLIKNKTLFQLLAEKTKAASKQAGCDLMLALMLSASGQKEVKEYFEQNAYFGLNPQQVTFFTQGNLPFLDKQGKPILDARDQVVAGPDGNGSMLWNFIEQGAWNKWKERGVEYINIVLIDNPLVDPFDAELVGFHASLDNEVTLKSILREDPLEKIGVIVRTEEGIRVVEYAEISDAERYARTSDGMFKHPCGNISCFCISKSFIDRLETIPLTDMPLHAAHKVLTEGIAAPLGIQPGIEHWKFEYFIFDMLKYTQRVGVLVYPRHECFAPLKNAQGPDSPETVRSALLARDRQILKELYGIIPSEGISFELDPQFYYPTAEVFSKWKGRKFTFENYYIDITD